MGIDLGFISPPLQEYDLFALGQRLFLIQSAKFMEDMIPEIKAKRRECISFEKFLEENRFHVSYVGKYKI